VSDGTRDRFAHMDVMPNLEWWGRIKAGWEQFDKDLAEFVPVEVVAAPVGKAPETLPALHIVLKGEVSASNLAEFKTVALTAIRSVNRDLQTDQDFADSAKARKWCEDIEAKVEGAKNHALSQTASIDELFRTMDEISAEARVVRLELEKLEKARNLSINGEVVADGVKQFADHIRALNAAMPSPYMPTIPADFGGCIKNLRTVASKKNAVATELARVKIIANEHATRIQGNLRTLAEKPAMAFLFPDVAQIVLKVSDDLQALVANRINEHQRQEAAKEEAQRERIRAEEAAKLQREADEKRRAEEAEAQRAAQAAIAVAATPAPAPAPVTMEQAVMAAAPEEISRAMFPPARVSPAIPTDSGARLSLGQINERIAPVSINVAGLAALGYEPVEQVKASRLYRESDFSAICAAIVRHVQGVALGVEA